jgi:hypothetical protein
VALHAAPYGDFSILTPFGRRMAKVLKHRAWLPNRDGTYRTVEVPGPDSYDVWYACWRVFACCCLMLRWPAQAHVAGTDIVVTPAALEYYQENFRQLAFEYSECWFLCCKAEDACRSEHLDRLRRRMALENAGQPVTWSDVLIRAADDSKYWDREVRRPAMLYLARGKRGGEPTAAYEEDPTGLTSKVNAQLSGGGKILPPPTASATEVPLKKKRKTKAEKVAAAVARVTSSPRSGNQPQPSRSYDDGGGSHPRKRGQFYTTSREGLEICFSFAKGNRDACPEPCHAGRAHICQICLGPHRNSECSRANNSKGGGKGAKSTK